MKQARIQRWNELAKVAEVADRARFIPKLHERLSDPNSRHSWAQGKSLHLQSLDASKLPAIKASVNSGLLTYLLHW